VIGDPLMSGHLGVVARNENLPGYDRRMAYEDDRGQWELTATGPFLMIDTPCGRVRVTEPQVRPPLAHRARTAADERQSKP